MSHLRIVVFVLISLINNNNNVNALSTQPQGLFDRFRPSCPADIGSIRRFDSSLTNNNDDADSDTATWIAIFRSANNKPSVYIRDDFMNAMKVATTTTDDDDGGIMIKSESMMNDDKIEITSNSVMESTETPVAIARLSPSQDKNCWILDNMRCSLKKEEMEEECDGGSEHTEALCVAIDAILIHHLTNQSKESLFFNGAIRTKATLVSAQLLEERGFEQVTALNKDMASHTSSLDACLESYANRVVGTKGGAGSRERAIKICSLLGKIDREKDLVSNNNNDDDKEEDYDPWAGIKKFL